MLITRKIGKVLLGGATPAQLMMATVIGAMLGSMPGFAQAAGVIALLTVLLVLLNANLVLAGVSGLVAAALAFPLAPVTFAVGRALLDGPTQPLFQWAINAPVLALFGFEYYMTTGGLVIGAVLGLVFGALVIRGVQTLRRRLAAIEEGSTLYQKWASRKWVKVVRYVIFGKAPKGGYKAALEAHGKIIRPLGIVAAVGLAVVIVLVNLLLADEIVTAALRGGLERANRATVDLDRAELNLRRGTLSIHGLAMADPNALDRNLFQAAELTADVSITDLLRKRLTLDQVTFNDATTGAERRVPGTRVGRRPSPSPPPDPTDEEKSIEDYLEQWDGLKDRLTQVREWVEWLAGSDEAAPEDEREPLKERLKKRIDEHGRSRVAATHLIVGRPTLTVRQLDAERVRAVQLDGEMIDIRGRHLSTHPHLLDESPQFVITTADTDRLLVDLELGAASRTRGESRVAFHYRGLEVDRLNEAIRFADRSPISDGTIDLELAGAIGAGPQPVLDLPLRVTLHGSTVRVADRAQRIDELPLALGLRGPIDNPAVRFDERELATALARSGAEQLAREALRDHAGVDVDDVLRGDVGGLLGRRGDGDGDSDGDDDGDDAGATDRARDLLERFR